MPDTFAQDGGGADVWIATKRSCCRLRAVFVIFSWSTRRLSFSVFRLPPTARSECRADGGGGGGGGGGGSSSVVVVVLAVAHSIETLVGCPLCTGWLLLFFLRLVLVILERPEKLFFSLCEPQTSKARKANKSLFLLLFFRVPSRRRIVKRT